MSEKKSLSDFHKFLIGLLLVALLGTWGIFLDSTGIIGHRDGYAYAAQDELQSQVNEAIKKPEFAWLNVEMKGQKAVVSGVAPSQEALEEAKRTIKSAAWVGGIIRGGVTVVDIDNVTVRQFEPLPIATPFTWKATKSTDQAVVLKGFVPSEEAREEIVLRALVLFPQGVIDEMTIANGAPASTWKNAALSNLISLSELEYGEVTAVDERFDLSGFAATEQSAKSATQRIDTMLPEGFIGSATLDIAPLEEVLVEEVIDAPQTQPVVVLEATAEAADLCQSEFDVAMQNQSIQFSSGSASLLPSSFPLLDQISEIALKCSNFNIVVSGHTDSTGSDTLNMALSQDRAQSVLAYLVSSNVPAQQVAARGFGESTPIASNATSAGRSINRRIEFTILRNTPEE